MSCNQHSKTHGCDSFTAPNAPQLALYIAVDVSTRVVGGLHLVPAADSAH